MITKVTILQEKSLLKKVQHFENKDNISEKNRNIFVGKMCNILLGKSFNSWEKSHNGQKCFNISRKKIPILKKKMLQYFVGKFAIFQEKGHNILSKNSQYSVKIIQLKYPKVIKL